MQENLRKAIAGALVKADISVAPEKITLEHPADLKNGDYSTGVALKFAKQASKNPKALAEEIVAALGSVDGVAKIEIAGPGFINFYLAPNELSASVNEATSEDMWGSNKSLAGKKIMVEYTDPNPFKEFHIGHLMSNAIGESISRLYQFSGAEVHRANYQGDVGPHVAKAIWGKMKSPELSWGQAYALGAAEYEVHKEEIDTLNQKIYDKSDPKIQALYDAGRKESLEHFEELYKILGTKFDHYFFESETAAKGLEPVRKHPEIFQESEGAIIYDGEKKGLHRRVFITSKGLPTYETKEIGLAEMKSEAWPSDESITITAHEQAGYFEVVKAAINDLSPELAQKMEHVSHGMMRLPSGKMSSRTGDVITGESLLNGLIDTAKERARESRAKDPEKLAQQVAVGAIKFQILKQDSGKDIIFDRERALSLEGDSGPYLQYAHARTVAILEKAQERGVAPEVDTHAEPSDLVRLLHRFPEIVENAVLERAPHTVTNYLIDVARTFSSWYGQEQILDGTLEAAHKVAVVEAVSHTLKNGLWVLGIPAPEKM